MPGGPRDFSLLFIELGAAIAGLALLARLSSRWGFSAIPLYLLAGLAFGNGGLLSLGLSEGFIHVGAEIGVLLLLFMLGLEYTGDELRNDLSTGLPNAAVDFLLNFTPGFAAGLWLGWGILPAVVLGGVTWVTSSGITARILTEFGWLENPESRLVLAMLVLEDLAMAIYLPLVSVVLIGGGVAKITASIGIALVAVIGVLLVALRYGRPISEWISHGSDEVVLLTVLGIVLLVAGLAQRVGVSPAVGAFLVGVALSGSIARQSHRLLSPLRDLFAATFFLFFGLEVNPASLPPVLVLAITLAVVTTVTKILTGIRAARREGLSLRAGIRAGTAMVSRGEFSIVIAGLATSAEPGLAPIAAAYVLLMAVLGPVLARIAK